MSVGGVDNSSRATPADTEAKQRAEARKREADIEKRYQARINQMQQEHHEKLKEISNKYQVQMDEHLEASKGAMTARDLKYQSEMEELKKLNREKMMNTTETYEERLKRTREASNNAIDNEKRVNQIQKQNMLDNFASNIEQKDRLYGEKLEENRVQQVAGMAKERRALEERHDSDVRHLTNERNDTVDRLSTNLRNTSQAKAIQEKQARNDLFRQDAKLRNIYGTELSREREVRNQMLADHKTDYDLALDDMRQKYTGALEERKIAQHEAFENLKDTVANREDGHVQVIERKLWDTEQKAIRNNIEQRRLHDLEKKHVFEDTKKALEINERNRQVALAAVNAKTAQEMERLSKQHSQNMNAQMIQDRQTKNLMKAQYEDEIVQKTSALQLENERLKIDSAMRDQKIHEIYARDKKNQEDYYAKNIEALKRSQEEALIEQRAIAAKERSTAITAITQQLRETEAKANQRLDILRTGHDKQIMDIKANHQKDLDIQRREAEIRLKNEQKAAVMNLESQKLKYESQITNLVQTYEDKIRQMEKNHEQEKIAMAKSTT